MALLDGVHRDRSPARSEISQVSGLGELPRPSWPHALFRRAELDLGKQPPVSHAASAAVTPAGSPPSATVAEDSDAARTLSRIARGVGNSWQKRVGQLDDDSFSPSIVDPLEYDKFRLWAEARVNKFIKSISQVIR